MQVNIIMHFADAEHVSIMYVHPAIKHKHIQQSVKLHIAKDRNVIGHAGNNAEHIFYKLIQL